jgi:hypothetical protein
MLGRQYYLTTLGAWRKRAAFFSDSHFVAATASPGNAATEDTPVLALISADEVAHASLENDSEFEPLPHPLVRVAVSARVAAALAPLGVVSTDDTFAVSVKLARVHPLLRHRVF